MKTSVELMQLLFFTQSLVFPWGCFCLFFSPAAVTKVKSQETFLSFQESFLKAAFSAEITSLTENVWAHTLYIVRV